MSGRLALLILVPVFVAAAAAAYLFPQAYEPDLVWHAERVVRAIQERDAVQLERDNSKDSGLISMPALVKWHAEAMAGCGPGRLEKALAEHLGTVEIVLVYDCAGGRQVRLETMVEQGRETDVQLAGPILFSGLRAKYNLPSLDDRPKYWRALAAAYRKENAWFSKHWPTTSHAKGKRTWLDAAASLEARADKFEKSPTPSAKTSSSSAPQAKAPPR